MLDEKYLTRLFFFVVVVFISRVADQWLEVIKFIFYI